MKKLLCLLILIPLCFALSSDAKMNFYQAASVGGGAAAGYGIWDSWNAQNIIDLAANKDVADGPNTITETSGEQAMVVGDGAEDCYTYDTHTEATTTDFYYIDVKFKIITEFGTTNGIMYLTIWQDGGTSPSTSTDVCRLYVSMPQGGGDGVADYTEAFYTDAGGAATKNLTNITHGAIEYRCRARIKADGSTNIQVKFDNDAAIEISSNGTTSKQADTAFMGGSAVLITTATGAVTVTHYGITKTISEIGLATWE